MGSPNQAEFWDERFAGADYTYGREPNDFLAAHAHLIPPGRVLCLGEGEGRNAVHLAKLGFEVTAVDFSKEGLKKTALLAAEQGVVVRTEHADLARYTFAESAYEGAVAIFAHLPPDVRRRVLAGVARTLVPGGVFVTELYTPKQLTYGTGGPRDVSLLATLAALRDELSPLHLEIGREVEREIHEGALHGGMSATVQVVARKTSPVATT